MRDDMVIVGDLYYRNILLAQNRHRDRSGQIAMSVVRVGDLGRRVAYKLRKVLVACISHDLDLRSA
jgi:hypothetical protein